MEDDGHYFSRATSGEGAVTSRRVPSRSRIHTGSIGDDPSFQNALDALRVTALPPFSASPPCSCVS